MPSFALAYVVEVVGARGAGQDRARVSEIGDGLVVALADGAGGTAHGAAAAQAVVDAVGRVALPGYDWCNTLSDLDRDGPLLRLGQTTAVIISIHNQQIEGASVGDSGAWLIGDTDILDLTHDQSRKPLVGGGCMAVRIPLTRFDHGTLLVASDGLFRYASRRDIAHIARGDDLASAARALVNLVRLPGGSLQDDVAIVLCRRRPAAPLVHSASAA
jgi:serine/threonine protein phosphatase PrpC